MLYFTDILLHEILFIFVCISFGFHLMISINIYDFASNGEDYQLNKGENDQVAKLHVV